jgi:hypothetical protein
LVLFIFLFYFFFEIQETSTSPGNGSIPGFGGNGQPGNIIEEMLLRQRLGQEIPHDGGGTIKRTESLYISPARKKEMVITSLTSNIHSMRECCTALARSSETRRG